MANTRRQKHSGNIHDNYERTRVRKQPETPPPAQPPSTQQPSSED